MLTPNMFQLEHRHLTHWVSLFKTLSKTFLLASHHVTRSNTMRRHLVALDNCNHIRVPLLIVRLFILNLTMYSIASRPTKQKPLIYLCLGLTFHLLSKVKCLDMVMIIVSTFYLALLNSICGPYSIHLIENISPLLVTQLSKPNLGLLKALTREARKGCTRMCRTTIVSQIYKKFEMVGT
jgi:hypothetical protein